MKSKITKRMLYAVVILSLVTTNFSIAQSSDIKLIAFNYIQDQGTNIVKWNAGETQFGDTYATNVEGIIVASSAFDSKRSNYFARVLDNSTGTIETRMIKFNTNSQNISLTPVESIFNGGSEVDMQTGFVYTYDGDNNNNVFLSKFDPFSGTQTNLGNFNFADGTNYFPDSTCYDSNSKKYYFLILEEDQVKLVTASVAAQPFTYTIIPLQNAGNAGNIGLEFSNETNTIVTMYSVFDEFNSSNNEIIIGNLNPITAELTTITTLQNISGYLFSSRTYDQDSESVIFVGYDAVFNANLYVVNTATSNVEALSLPVGNINEIECDNSLYAEAKYGALAINEFSSNTIRIYPNPVNDYFQVSFDGGVSNYTIIDLLGKVVQSGEITPNQLIDVTNLSNGMYVFNLVNDTETITQKISVD